MRRLTREDVIKMSVDELEEVMGNRASLSQVIQLGEQSEAVSNKIDAVLDQEFAAMTPAEKERITRLAERVRRRQQAG